MNNRLILLAAIYLSFICNFLSAQCPDGWVRQGGGSNNRDVAVATAIDRSGNIYVTGQYSDTATFSSQVLISSSYEDIYLAKYDPNGSLIWIRSAGGYNTDFPWALAIDSSNNVYITGTNFGSADFDTINLPNFTGYPNAFVAKYDSLGNVQWAKAIGSTDWDEGKGIDVRGNNLYITGSFSLSVNFGSTTLISTGQRDVYLAKLDLNGNYIWARSAGGLQIDLGTSLMVDDSNNVFLLGNFFDDMVIGSTPLSNAGYFDYFLAKYDDNGTLIWAVSAGGPLDDYAPALAIDNSSNVYVSLSGSNGCVFGSLTVNTYGDKDIMLAKYDTDGDVVWVKNSGGVGRDIGAGITVLNDNKIYQTGNFSGNAAFGSIALNIGGSDNIFLAEYDSAGTVNFVKHAGGMSSDEGDGIACSVDDVFVCGAFSGTTSFGSNSITADLNGGNAFIWKACSGPVGIEETNEVSASDVYPNPFTDALYISTADNGTAEVTVWDLSGRCIMRESFTGSIMLNTSQIAKGIYVYEVRNENGIEQRDKVVKE